MTKRVMSYVQDRQQISNHNDRIRNGALVRTDEHKEFVRWAAVSFKELTADFTPGKMFNGVLTTTTKGARAKRTRTCQCPHAPRGGPSIENSLKINNPKRWFHFAL